MVVAKPVAARCRDGKTRPDPLKQSAPEGQTFDPVEPRDVRDVPRREGEVPAARQCLGADERSRFVLNFLYIFIRDRSHIRRQRIQNVADERERILCSLRRRRHHDLRPREVAGGNSLVHFVAADLPPAADDAARGIVEPRAGAANLDLLTPRQPEAAFDERVLEDDRNILQILVDERGTREAERHANDFSSLAVDVDGAHGARLAVVLRTHFHLIDVEHAGPEANLKRVVNGEIVDPEAGCRERMRDVLDLVAFAYPDDVPEVVLDDAEVVAVVIDVGRQEQSVAAPHDALLAQIGSAPVDFQPQLVRLHDFWRLGESLSKLCEECHVAVRRRLVVGEGGVGDLTGSSLGGALDELARAGIVPRLLSAEGVREDDGRKNPHRTAKPHGIHRERG